MSVLTATQVSVNLSVNVITKDGAGFKLAVIPLVNLSWLIMAIWRYRLMMNRCRFKLHRLAYSITEQLDIAGKMVSISFNSLAWGIGLCTAS